MGYRAMNENHDVEYRHKNETESGTIVRIEKKKVVER